MSTELSNSKENNMEFSISDMAKKGAETKGSFQIMDMILLLEQGMPPEEELIKYSEQRLNKLAAIIPLGLNIPSDTKPELFTITTSWKGRDIVEVFYGYKNIDEKLEFVAGTKLLLPEDEINELAEKLKNTNS